MERESYFDGTFWGLVGTLIVCFLQTLFTLGIGTAWAVCRKQRWELRHTVIEGKRLEFLGRGGSLLGKWIIWGLLSLITIGIFALWIPMKKRKWFTENTRFAFE